MMPNTSTHATARRPAAKDPFRTRRAPAPRYQSDPRADLISPFCRSLTALPARRGPQGRDGSLPSDEWQGNAMATRAAVGA
jgi:hypothetical protein